MIQQNRFYNPLLNPLYEGCDIDDLCVATYLIGAAKEEGAILKAEHRYRADYRFLGRRSG